MCSRQRRPRRVIALGSVDGCEISRVDTERTQQHSNTQSCQVSIGREDVGRVGLDASGPKAMGGTAIARHMMAVFSLKLPDWVAASPHQLVDDSTKLHSPWPRAPSGPFTTATALAQPAATPRLHHQPSGVEEHIEVESSELSEPPTSQPPVGRDIEVDWTCALPSRLLINPAPPRANHISFSSHTVRHTLLCHCFLFAPPNKQDTSLQYDFRPA